MKDESKPDAREEMEGKREERKEEKVNPKSKIQNPKWIAPAANIRRFDVFAEWSRLTGREKHQLPEGSARAYGIAVAKIVAARKFAGYQPQQVRTLKQQARQQDASEPWWEHLGTPVEFDRKIIRRMGQRFYQDVFQPAIRQAWDAGETYEQIRDRLREPWNALLTPQEPSGDQKE